MFAQTTGATNICEVKTDRLNERNKQIHNLVGDIITPLSTTDRTKKISKDVQELNTTNQQNLIDIYRTFHPTTAEYPFFLSLCDTWTISWASKQISTGLKE